MPITNFKLTTVAAILMSIMLVFFSSSAFTIGVEADDFITRASASGVAEIESGKIALEKTTYPEIKEFAKKMIENYASSNKDLRELAAKKDVEIADEAVLLDKAKAYVLKQREGESFDVAYVNNQIDAHRETIKLYEQASSSPDEDVRRLAATSLPRLEQHLEEAEALVAVIARGIASAQ